FDHILTKCDAPGQAFVWSLTRNLWLSAYPDWYAVTTHLILGCGATVLPSANNKPDSGASRLYCILLSETAYLIWKLCCK
ncbi:uncharacterized protein PHACADRAFT_108560, partial [Phanerochaete carnosa HHB-10118-sp]